MGNAPTIYDYELTEFKNSTLLWLDSNVNNSENKEYQNLIKKFIYW